MNRFYHIRNTHTPLSILINVANGGNKHAPLPCLSNNVRTISSLEHLTKEQYISIKWQIQDDNVFNNNVNVKLALYFLNLTEVCLL